MRNFCQWIIRIDGEGLCQWLSSDLEHVFAYIPDRNGEEVNYKYWEWGKDESEIYSFELNASKKVRDTFGIPKLA